MTISAPASPPEPRGANRKAVGLLLAPGRGRLTALAIVGVPLIIFLIIGFTTTSSSGGVSNYNGQQGPAQYGNGSGLYSPSPLPSPSPSAQATASDSSSPNVFDSSSDTATASDSASATDTSSATADPTASGPAATVLEAYADINHQDYLSAYNLGLAGATSYGTFVQYYSQYSSIQVSIDSVQDDVVTANLTSTYTSGQTEETTNTYTVSGGVITVSQIH